MSKFGPDIGHLILTPSENNRIRDLGYKVIRKLGEGSYAKVYLSEYTYRNKMEFLACKIIDTKRAPKDFIQRFLPRELEVLAQLEHPYIIHTQSIFQRGDKYFIFMAHGANGDLLDYISNNGPIPESLARIWFRQITLAIQYMHEMEYVHRDLKCENILISLHNNMKIADFGFARLMIGPNKKPELSKTYCGSLSYAAPEILKGEPYNPKFADHWSMGIILYVMLNKSLPFDDSNVKRLYNRQIGRQWRFRARIIDHLSREAQKVVTFLLEPLLRKRYRIENILKSEWITQDKRLITMSPLEQAALMRAQECKKKLKTTNNKTFIPKKDNSIIIIKPVSSFPQEESTELSLP